MFYRRYYPKENLFLIVSIGDRMASFALSSTLPTASFALSKKLLSLVKALVRPTRCATPAIPSLRTSALRPKSISCVLAATAIGSGAGFRILLMANSTGFATPAAALFPTLSRHKRHGQMRLQAWMPIHVPRVIEMRLLKFYRF